MIVEAEGTRERNGDGDPSELVRVSQIPSINLMVDLNDARCRRRRRMQFSNLLSISEEVDPNHEQLESISSFSSDDPNQSNSTVIREIRATMEIGGQLGIIFRPNDDVILGKMIEIEAQEYSSLLEREARG